MTSSNNNRVEVITSTEKRRRWSAYEKRTIVEETYRPGMSVSYIARKNMVYLRAKYSIGEDKWNHEHWQA